MFYRIMKLIDKDALVAKIEKRLDELYSLLPDASKVENGMITILEACNTGKYTTLESILSLVKEELEVKEVQEESASDDLEEEIIRYIGFPQEVDEDVSTTMIREAAHHFANWQKEQLEKERKAK